VSIGVPIHRHHRQQIRHPQHFSHEAGQSAILQMAPRALELHREAETKQMTVTMRGYFDMSGNADRTILAGYSAPPETWRKFEERWREILHASVPQCSYFHAHEAKNLKGQFCEQRGWTRQKVDSLLKTLTMECILPFGRGSGDDGLFAISCAVELVDFERAREDLRTLRGRGVNWVCAEYVTAATILLLPKEPGMPIGFRRGSAEL
jgi:hypothetical protein